ncbi:MAG: LytR C-terminal domain-containing protein [Marmoricola sp.]
MTQPENARVISWVTLAVAGVCALVMAIWGFNSLTAPVKKDQPAATTTNNGGCVPQGASYVHRGDVTVSVFNAGKKTGRAQSTLDQLERAGFVPGAVGNAPTGDKVARAEVHTTKADDPRAQLVALALGKGAKVVVTTVIGPGLDVIIGDKFKRLDPGAPQRVRASAAVTC